MDTSQLGRLRQSVERAVAKEKNLPKYLLPLAFGAQVYYAYTNIHRTVANGGLKDVDTEAWIVTGLDTTGEGGITTISVIDYIPERVFHDGVEEPYGTVQNDRPAVFAPPQIFLTPISTSPVMLSAAFSMDPVTDSSVRAFGMNGRILDRDIGTVHERLVIKVHSWLPSGDPAPFCMFSWQCIAEGGFIGIYLPPG